MPIVSRHRFFQEVDSAGDVHAPAQWRHGHDAARNLLSPALPRRSPQARLAVLAFEDMLTIWPTRSTALITLDPRNPFSCPNGFAVMMESPAKKLVVIIMAQTGAHQR
jgi:hypothetical protein